VAHARTGPFGLLQEVTGAPANGGAKSVFGLFRGEKGSRQDDDGRTDGAFAVPVGAIRG